MVISWHFVILTTVAMVFILGYRIGKYIATSRIMEIIYDLGDDIDKEKLMRKLSTIWRTLNETTK